MLEVEPVVGGGIAPVGRRSFIRQDDGCMDCGIVGRDEVGMIQEVGVQ